MRKIILLGLSLLFFQVENSTAMTGNGTYKSIGATLQGRSMEQQVQRFVKNVYRFLALRRFVAYNTPSANIYNKLAGIEQCFFVIFCKFSEDVSRAYKGKKTFENFIDKAKETLGEVKRIGVPYRKSLYKSEAKLPTVVFCASEISKLRGDFSKEKYDLVLSIQAVFEMFKAKEAVAYNSSFMSEANTAIEVGLRELASDWVKFGGLFTEVSDKNQTEILAFLRGDRNVSRNDEDGNENAVCVLSGLKEIKFVNFLSSGHDKDEKRKKKEANSKRLEELDDSLNRKTNRSLLDNNEKAFDQFLGTIRPTIPLQILTDVKESKEDLKISNIQLENAKEGTHYRPLTNCLRINLKNASGSFPTPFHFEGATPDGTGQFLFDPSKFGMGMAHLLYHEGGHALTEAFNTIFEILENEEEVNESPVSLVVGKKNNDEESDTMRAAACMFSGDTTVKISSFIEELSKFWGMPARSDKAEYKGKTLQQIYASIRDSKEEWKKFPENLRDISRFFEKLIYSDEKIEEGVTNKNGQYIEEKISSNNIDKGKIAKLLLSENREVMQILGFRIHNDVLYVNGLSDFALFAGQRLPVNMVHQNIYGTVKRRDLLKMPIDEKLKLLLEHPTYFIEFKTKMNRKFLSALFSLYGDKIDSYMSGMKNRIEGGK